MATASTSKQTPRSRSNSRHRQSNSKPNRSNSKPSSQLSKGTSSGVSSQVVGKRRSGSLRHTIDLSYSLPASPEEEVVIPSSESQIDWDAIEILEETRKKYLIKWAGVNPDTNEPWDPSWEPKENAGEALVKAWMDSKAARKTRSSIGKRRTSGVLTRSTSPKRRRIIFEDYPISQKRHSRQHKRIRNETSDSEDEEVLPTQDKGSNINNNKVTPVPDASLPIFLLQSPHSKGKNSRVNPLHLRTPSGSDSVDANEHTVPTPRSPTNIEHVPSPSPPANVPLSNPSPRSLTLSKSNTRISERSPRSPGQAILAKPTVHVSDTLHKTLSKKPSGINIFGTRSNGSSGQPPLPPPSHDSSTPKRPPSRGLPSSRAASPFVDINSGSNGAKKRDLEVGGFHKRSQRNFHDTCRLTDSPIPTSLFSKCRKKPFYSHILRDAVEPSEFQLGSTSSLFRAEESLEESVVLAPDKSNSRTMPEEVEKPTQEPPISHSPSRFLDASPRRKTTPQPSSDTSAELSSQPTDEVAQMIATFNDYTQTSSRISLQRFISACDIDPVDRNMLITYLDNPKAFLSHPQNGIQEAQRAYGGKEYIGFELQQETNGSICLWIELDEPDNPKTTVRWESGRSLEKLSVSLVSYHNPVAEGAFLASPRPDRKRTPVPLGCQPLHRTPESRHTPKDNLSPAKNAPTASGQLEATTSVSANDMGRPDASPITCEEDIQQELVLEPGPSDDSHRLSIDSDFLFTTERCTPALNDDLPKAIPEILIASPAEPVQPGIMTQNVSPAKNALIASEQLEATTSVSAKDMGSPDASSIVSEKDTQQEHVHGPGPSDDPHRLSIDSDFLYTTERCNLAPIDDTPKVIPEIFIASPAEPIHPDITTRQSQLSGQHGASTSNPRHSSPSQQPDPNTNSHIPTNHTLGQRSDIAIVVSHVHDVPSQEGHNASSHAHSLVQNLRGESVPSSIVPSIVNSTHESSRGDGAADQQVGAGDDEGSQATTVEESHPREHSSTVSASETDSPEKLKKDIYELTTSVKFLRSLLGGALDLHARAQGVEDISYSNSLTQQKVEELEEKLSKQEKHTKSWQEKYKAKDIEITGVRVQLLDFMSQNDALSKENRALRARLKDSNHPARHVYEAFSTKMKADVARLESENHLSKQTIKRLQARLCEQSNDEDQDGLEFRVANLESKNETLKEELSLLAQAEAKAQTLVSEARAAEAIHRQRAERLEAALQTNADILVDTENSQDEDSDVDDDDLMAQARAKIPLSDDENTTRSTQDEDMPVRDNRSNTDTSDIPESNAEEAIIDHEASQRRSAHPESVKKATRSSVINLLNARSSYLEPSTEGEEDIKPRITDTLEMLNDERPSTQPERINLTMVHVIDPENLNGKTVLILLPNARFRECLILQLAILVLWKKTLIVDSYIILDVHYLLIVERTASNPANDDEDDR
ncbi:uncharacterized protein MELLADRAFT_88202 [Melampsora larici-populina 98AG31]|uniref:Chromo domain-containing protein n=1 Tax=Melampsora larici-populina (strain 98AG31 / pathotype 3-4-7) TaxID=747676 RepID=F4RQX9_MELLP|nr:uncharacterized protein MELLADRAFT_88202 [Melampsora larici-populina 98AG31]EGG05244.1 hypothetical protein MELLADRAFT_88202 [Melampsora larici-populina 98AG31]